MLCIILYSVVLHCTLLFCIVPHSVALHFTLICCTTCIPTCIHTCIHTHAICAHTHACTHACTHAHTQTHTLIHTPPHGGFMGCPPFLTQFWLFSGLTTGSHWPAEGHTDTWVPFCPPQVQHAVFLLPCPCSVYKCIQLIVESVIGDLIRSGLCHVWHLPSFS